MESKNKNYNRREFLSRTVSGMASVGLLGVSGKALSSLDRQELTPGPNKKIIYRTLGKTGIKLPIVSMGVMNSDNPNLVKAALDTGIVHLDTANVYLRGNSERVIGEVLERYGNRDKVYVATKMRFERDRWKGIFSLKGGEDPAAVPENLFKQLETSLQRLRTDYVDILYLHSCYSPQMANFEPLMNALVKVKKQGKARFIGTSTHIDIANVIRATVDAKVYDVVLTAYNFRQSPVKEIEKAIDYAAKAGLGVIAMKTQAGVYWDREKKHQINMKAALKWALQNENICTAIPGITTFDQLNMDISVMEDLTLSPKEKADLKLGQKRGMKGLYCQQCGKCIAQCRESLNIPTLMRSYMYAYGYRNSALAKETLQSVDLPNAPCTNCHTCTVTCTMGFDVRNKILDIVRLKDVPEDFLV